MASAVDKMVSQFVDNVYDRLKANVKENRFQPYESWVIFIETNKVLDNSEDTVAEMAFEE
ncbi:hypothetical protein FAM18175_02844 [Lacticaseibacillus paracasei]|nr:hypothetical protein FAM18175_02844 [Lacticaseibacillus paracasei]